MFSSGRSRCPPPRRIRSAGPRPRRRPAEARSVVDGGGLAQGRAAVREQGGAVRLRAGEQHSRVLARERGGLSRPRARVAGRGGPWRHRRPRRRARDRPRPPHAPPRHPRRQGDHDRGCRPGAAGARARDRGAAVALRPNRRPALGPRADLRVPARPGATRGGVPARAPYRDCRTGLPARCANRCDRNRATARRDIVLASPAPDRCRAWNRALRGTACGRRVSELPDRKSSGNCAPYATWSRAGGSPGKFWCGRRPAARVATVCPRSPARIPPDPRLPRSAVRCGRRRGTTREVRLALPCMGNPVELFEPTLPGASVSGRRLPS